MKKGHTILVETSPVRIFADENYKAAGAELVHELPLCDIALGIKELLVERITPGQRYCFFSHTIKGQSHNMPLLKALLDAQCTLYDYELIRDEAGQRVVFFGNYAGYAGMLHTLRAFGHRAPADHPSTLLKELRSPKEYASLEDAKKALTGIAVKMQGMPVKETVTGLFTGYGNVSRAAQEIAALLPGEKVSPSEFRAKAKESSQHFLWAELGETDIYLQKEGAPTTKEEVFSHPENLKANLESWLDMTQVLVHGIYWDPRYPRLLGSHYLSSGSSALRVIGDITCDIDGSLVTTKKASTSEEPIYMYHPHSGDIRDGLEGEGIAIMAVDNLPAELPLEASEHFAASLLPFVEDLGQKEVTSVKNSEVKKALIAESGELAAEHKHLKTFM